MLTTFFGLDGYVLDDGLGTPKYRIMLYETGQRDDPMCPDDIEYAELVELVQQGGEGSFEEQLAELQEQDPAAYKRELQYGSDPENPGKLLINDRWTSRSGIGLLTQPWLRVMDKTYPLSSAEYQSGAARWEESPRLKTTPESATGEAIRLLEQIGAEGWIPSGIVFSIDDNGFIVPADDAAAYRVVCVPMVNQTEVLWHGLSPDGGVVDQEDEAIPLEMQAEMPAEEYAPTWAQPSLYMDINDDGLQKLYWASNFTVTDVHENPAESLKPLADVVNAAVEEMMIRMQVYNPPVIHDAGSIDDSPRNEEGISTRLSIDQIEFGLTRVPVKDSVGSYQLVPSWDFIGTVEGWNEQTGDFELLPRPYTGDKGVLLTLDARDLSVIDRSRA
ncbi:MAG: hypothetical protein HDQ87_09720 [Clostridia bacterium]|nr:hypothetical protein [Clostridia bacterium]